MFAYALGAPIPWLMMSELSAPEVKGLSVSISAASNWITGFVITQTYPLMSQTVGNYGTFWVYGSFIAIALMVIVIYVPETKDRSLEEIQQFFRSNINTDGSSMLDNAESMEEEEARHYLGQRALSL